MHRMKKINLYRRLESSLQTPSPGQHILDSSMILWA